MTPLDQVKRYDYESDYGITAQSDGDYVLYTDYAALEAENARLKSEQKGMVRADVLLRYGRLYHRKYMMFPFPFITTQLIASRAGRER